MTNRGLRCPLNGAGLKIITRGGNEKEMITFMSRVVNDALRGQAKSKDKLNRFVKGLLQGESPRGLTIDWNDLMIELTQVDWIEGATLPENIKKSIRKKSDEIEAEKLRAKQPESKNDKGHGKVIGMDRLAALQARLKAGDLSGPGAGAAKEEEVAPKVDKRKVAFDDALKGVLEVLRELGGKITTAELQKVSTFGRINPRIRFLTQPGEYSDLLNQEFGAKYEVGEIERVKETLKKIVRNRKSAANTAKSAAKSTPKKEVKAADNSKRTEFDNVLKTLLGVLSKELGGSITADELSKASPMGNINPRVRFLLKPGEYSDLLNAEFGGRLEVSELRRLTITLKKISHMRRDAPKKAKPTASKPKKAQNPMTCVITRNIDVFKKRCKAVGVTLPEKTVQKLLGTKHIVSQFEDDKAMVELDGKKIWVPDSEVLIKLGAPRKVTPTPRNPTQSNDALKPLKRAPESPKRSPGADKSTRVLEEKIRSLERDLVVAEKQKEIYKAELATVKARSGRISSTKAPNDKNTINLISSSDFEQKVKAFPSSSSKLTLIPSTDSNGLEKIHLFLWLEQDAKPTFSFETVYPDATIAEDLACTTAYERLKKHRVYRKHFT
jgi:uncharacterized membrane protein